MTMLDIKIELTTNKKVKPDDNKLGFGQLFYRSYVYLRLYRRKGLA